jgi:hypothetical protein
LLIISLKKARIPIFINNLVKQEIYGKLELSRQTDHARLALQITIDQPEQQLGVYNAQTIDSSQRWR